MASEDGAPETIEELAEWLAERLRGPEVKQVGTASDDPSFVIIAFENGQLFGLRVEQGKPETSGGASNGR